MMAAELEALIPHRAPMRWIDALTHCTDTEASATVCIQAGHYAVVDGSLLESALIECVAQTVAAATGYRAMNRGLAAVEPSKQHDPAAGQMGMLVAVSEFHIQERPPVGSSLRIEVREIKRVGQLMQVSAVVSREDKTVASGKLTVYA